MNRIEADVLKMLYEESFLNQRALSEASGYSLGAINKALQRIENEGYVDEDMRLTVKARDIIRSFAPRNAIILAAGAGMRMVPINTTGPKAFLEVEGERLIERLIWQLNEVGIEDITVVVGFMKDAFEYLIDDFGVDLIVNRDYSVRNNLHSLALAADRICNTYVVPCDIWCASNVFSDAELYSWYAVSDHTDNESVVRINRKGELVTVKNGDPGNKMIGISYISEQDAAVVRERLLRFDDEKHAESFWEDILYDKGKMIIFLKYR